MFQPLLGKVAPARHNVSAARPVYTMCRHKSARKEKNGRRRNRDESTARDNVILWKTSWLSST
jgi:hypothetical protein